MDLNPEFYHLSGGSAKKWTLIIDFVQIFRFFLVLVIFGHFGPLGGPLRTFCYSWGPPRTSMRWSTSITTLPPCLISRPVQFSEFEEFWGGPMEGHRRSAPRSDTISGSRKVWNSLILSQFVIGNNGSGMKILFRASLFLMYIMYTFIFSDSEL